MDSHPVEQVRHMTSSSALRSSQRTSQLLRLSPARSPTSIPSSPTSVHSSSSAIFERDIEPPLHRRSKTTEQLQHSVPSVLDSAAAILAGIGPEDEHQSDQIAVISPANNSSFGSGFASPIGSFGSRSPSPTIGSLAGAAVGNRGSLLLNIPSPASAPVPAPAVSSSPPLRVRPIITTDTAQSSPSAPPSIVTPTSAYFTTASGSEPNSPTTTTIEHPTAPLPNPRASSSSPPPHALPSTSTSPHDISIAPPPKNTQHPPSPSLSPTIPKRLSFISYSHSSLHTLMRIF